MSLFIGISHLGGSNPQMVIQLKEVTQLSCLQPEIMPMYRVPPAMKEEAARKH